jgi:hypothetical protein
VPIAIAAIRNTPPVISHRIGALERKALISKEPLPFAVMRSDRFQE